MSLLLLLAAAAAPTAVDAERAFASDARTKGQWTAFRAWSAEDAQMFGPGPVNVHAFLKDKKDPAAAMSWSPGESYVSCDGGHAVNKGPWTSASGKAHGYFTTVWVRQPGPTWKWVYDGGDSVSEPLPAVTNPTVTRASCNGKAPPLQRAVPLADGFTGRQGESADHSLRWTWTMDPAGTRHFVTQLWNGRSFDTVLDQRVASQ